MQTGLDGAAGTDWWVLVTFWSHLKFWPVASGLTPVAVAPLSRV